MKKILFTLITCFMISLSFSSISQASDKFYNNTENLNPNDNHYYVDTVITEYDTEILDINGVTRSSKTASKTDYVRDANQNVLWYVTITATFTYDGVTSSCTSCSHQAGSNNSHWSIKSCTSSINGNSATATAIATQTLLFGITHDYTHSVTIYCSPDGTIS